MNWSQSKFSQFAEAVGKFMACAALFSIVLPTAVPNICMALFLICSLIAGNYKFKLHLIINNSIAVLCILLFLLFAIGLLYTSAPPEEAFAIFEKYAKFIYVPFLLFAFYEEKWKRFGYIAFLLGVTLMMGMSYLTLLGWSPESLYSGTYAGRDEHIVFRSRIAHGMLVALAAYLYLLHALDAKKIGLRVVFVLLAIFASINILTMVASRSAQLLWIILLVLLVFQYLDWKRSLLSILVIPVLAVSIMFANENTRVRIYEIFNDIELIKEKNYASSLGNRIIWAQAGIETIKNDPIIGTGTGSFKHEFDQYIETRDIPNKYTYSSMNPHNEYISIGVQLGLLGLFLYIAIFVQQWKISNSLPLLMNHIAKGGIVTLVISGVLNSVIYAHTQGVFFALFTALMFSSYKSYIKQK